MKSRSAILSVAVAGCLIGFFGARLAGDHSKDFSTGEAARGGVRRGGASGALAASPGSGRSGDSRVPEKRRSFAALVRDAPVIAERDQPCRDVERMDAGQLKSAILGSLPQPGVSSALADREAVARVLSAAARELYKREGEKALEWAAAEAPAEQRAAVLSELLNAAAKDSPDLVKAWTDRYRGEFGDEWAKRFNLAAVMGAVERSAYELLRVRELLSTRLLPGESVSYPEDFDFHLLVTRSPPVWNLYAPVTYWAGVNKEAAWKGVKQVMDSNPGSGIGFVGCTYRGVLAIEGNEKAAEWIATKLGEVPAEHRQRAIQALGSYPPLGPEASAALVRAIPDTADRVFFASGQFAPGKSSNLAVLQALDSPQLQTEALAAAATRHARFAGANSSGDEMRASYTSTMEQLRLDPQSREKVMAVLAGSKTP